MKIGSFSLLQAREPCILGAQMPVGMVNMWQQHLLGALRFCSSLYGESNWVMTVVVLEAALLDKAESRPPPPA